MPAVWIVLRVNYSGQFAMGNEDIFNLQDMLFKYGARINADVAYRTLDLCNPIPMVVGQTGNGPQTEMFPWPYYPLLVSDNKEAIVKNLDPVASFFPSSIDTMKNPGVSKTILLHTSEHSKAQLAPTRVHFGILQSKPNPAYYGQKNLAVAVLLQGKFESVFKNRLSPAFIAASDTVASMKFIEESKENKMIVISNGDIIKNEIRRDSSVYPLGYYKFTNRQFANRDFILNCVEYLVDNSGILETRNKEVKLRLLDNIKVEDEKLKWQVVNLVLPIGLLIVFGLWFNYRRKRRYGT